MVSDCRFGVSPVNYPDPDPKRVDRVRILSIESGFDPSFSLEPEKSGSKAPKSLWFVLYFSPSQNKSCLVLSWFWFCVRFQIFPIPFISQSKRLLQKHFGLLPNMVAKEHMRMNEKICEIF